MIPKILAACLFASGLAAAEWRVTPLEPETDYRLRVVPQPQQVSFTGERTTIAAGTAVRLETEEPLAREAAALLERQLKRNSLAGKRGEVAEVVLRLSPDEARPEGYHLTIARDRVTVTGNSGRGVLWGVQTLRQLLTPEPGGTSRLPLGEVTDSPDLAWRGAFTSGIGRSEEQREVFLDTLSLLKMNVLIVRVDQWMKYGRVPGLAHSSARSPEEYRAFVRRGRALGLEMIPNNSLYSHFAWALWGPYGHLIEVPQKAISNFSAPDIDNPGTAKLIRAIMEDVHEAFDRPRYYHVGQDELKYAPRRKGDTPDAFRSRFDTALKLLKRNCDDLGSQMIMWADQMLESRSGGAPDNTWFLRRELSREVIQADFTYFAGRGFRTIPELTKDGFPVLGTAWYEPDCIAEYCEVLKNTPGALGLIASMWGGLANYFTTPEHQLALAWAAENSWSVGKPAWQEYRNFPTDTFYFASKQLRPLVRSWRPVALGETARTPCEGKGALFGRGEALGMPGIPKELSRQDFSFETAGKCLLLGGSGGAERAELAFAPETADSIAFLHVSDLPPRRALAFTNLDNKGFYDPKKVAEYEVGYADGTSVKIPLNYTGEITDWNEPAGAAAAPVIHAGKTANGKLARLFGYRWVNPQPGKKIAKITLTSGNSPVAVAVFAVSLERYQ